MMTMTMSGYDYDAHRPHSHSSGNGHGAQRGGNGNDRCREWESNNNNKPVQEDHPFPSATGTSSSAAAVNADSGHRYSLPWQSQSFPHAYQYHPYPFQMQMQNQNGSFLQLQGRDEENSASAFTFTNMMPNMYNNDATPATLSSATYEDPLPNRNWNHHPLEQNEEGGDLFNVNDTSIQNPYEYPPHHHYHYQGFPPSHAQTQLLQLQRASLNHSHPPSQQQEHRVDNQLPLSFSVPYPPSSPLPLTNQCHQFGNEYFMSPERPRSSQVQAAPARLNLKDPPPASPVDSKEMKASNDSGVEESVDLPPTFPKLQVKGARTRTRTRKIATTTSSRHQNVWDRKFNELLEYKQQHGHCDVPQTYPPNPSLGLWVNKQRMEHKNRDDRNVSTLTDERLERLQSIGFRWAKRRGQVRWDEKYNELLEYANKFGNCHVPTKFKENTALGRWVSTQRAEYKKFCNGQKSSLTNSKIRRLDSIGFAWFMAL